MLNENRVREKIPIFRDSVNIVDLIEIYAKIIGSDDPR